MLSRRTTVSSKLLGELRISGELADGAFAGVDLGYQFVGVGDGRVQVVVERVVLEKLAGSALPSSRPAAILLKWSMVELARS